MSLDMERQKELQPTRTDYARRNLEALGFEVKAIQNGLTFIFNGHKVTLFPYSGWHTGKSIKDGRGLQKLLNQLTDKI